MSVAPASRRRRSGTGSLPGRAASSARTPRVVGERDRLLRQPRGAARVARLPRGAGRGDEAPAARGVVDAQLRPHAAGAVAAAAWPLRWRARSAVRSSSSAIPASGPTAARAWCHARWSASCSPAWRPRGPGARRGDRARRSLVDRRAHQRVAHLERGAAHVDEPAVLGRRSAVRADAHAASAAPITGASRPASLAATSSSIRWVGAGSCRTRSRKRRSTSRASGQRLGQRVGARQLAAGERRPTARAAPAGCRRPRAPPGRGRRARGRRARRAPRAWRRRRGRARARAISGRPRASTSGPSSPRSASSTATPSAPRRRTTNSSVSRDGWSSHCRSSTRHSTGWRSAASASRLRQATEMRKRSAPRWPSPSAPSQRGRLRRRQRLDAAAARAGGGRAARRRGARTPTRRRASRAPACRTPGRERR